MDEIFTKVHFDNFKQDVILNQFWSRKSILGDNIKKKRSVVVLSELIWIMVELVSSAVNILWMLRLQKNCYLVDLNDCELLVEGCVSWSSLSAAQGYMM
jgi:hypothetical protein